MNGTALYLGSALLAAGIGKTAFVSVELTGKHAVLIIARG